MAIGRERAIGILRDEISEWERGEARISPDVSYPMRDIVEKARKNHAGVYEQEHDPVTGRRKVFYPLSKSAVETVVKNVDLDTSDVEVQARKASSSWASCLARQAILVALDDAEFGSKLNSVIRRMAIDGTGIWKTWEQDGKMRLRIVDRLSVLVDPSARTLDESSAIIERNELTISEFREYDWENTEGVEGSDMVERVPMGGFASTGQGVRTRVPYVDVYERYGLLPGECVGSGEDYVYCQLVVSGMDSEEPRVHKVRRVDSHPYSAVRLREVPNRFDGEGVCEQLFDAQAYINEVINTRLASSRIKQLGLWQVRKGSGITPPMLTRLYSNSVIPVTAMNADIGELPTSDIKQSSYEDEARIDEWAQKVTGTFEVSTGQRMPSSTPATIGVIQDRAAGRGYALVMENVGLFLEKWLREKAWPIIRRNLSEGDVLRLSGEPRKLLEMDAAYADWLTDREVARYYDRNGHFPPPEDLARERRRIMEKLSKPGRERFVRVKKKLMDADFDIRFKVTGEKFDTAAKVNQMNMLFQTAAAVPNLGIDLQATFMKILDLMGLDGSQFAGSSQAGSPPAVPEAPPTEGSPMVAMPGGGTQGTGASASAR